MLQFGAALNDDTSSVNYDRNMFIIQATGHKLCSTLLHQGWLWNDKLEMDGVCNLPAKARNPCWRGKLSTIDLLELSCLGQLLLILQTLFASLQNSYLNKEVNGTEPSPSVGIPWRGNSQNLTKVSLKIILKVRPCRVVPFNKTAQLG